MYFTGISRRKIGAELKTSFFFFNVGITGSGFPFDFGRIPYKGKRPLKEMIGSYKNRHSIGDPSPEVPSGSGSANKPASEMQLLVRNQQEELERLRKDLASQKVILLPQRLYLISHQQARDRRRKTQLACFSDSVISQKVLFP